ncbi:MAG: hypothetical protein HY399_06890 [Elusimicrobia bacterium]|nr:hypothetical protein [Elusimicrobiota bacterium]
MMFLILLSSLISFATPIPGQTPSPPTIKLELRAKPTVYVLYICFQGEAYEATNQELAACGLEINQDGLIRDTVTDKILSLEDNYQTIYNRAFPVLRPLGPCAPSSPVSTNPPTSKVLEQLEIPTEVSFDGLKKKPRVTESFYINDYAGPVRISPPLYSSAGRKRNPQDRTLLTVGITKHQQGTPTKIEYATYQDDWYIAQKYHNVSMVLHLNGLSDKLPYYIFTDLYTAHHPQDYNKSLQADTFGLGMEQFLSPNINFQVEVAKGYYSGQTAMMMGARLTANASLNNLMNWKSTPPGITERPFISAGTGILYSENTHHLRWNSTLRDEGFGKFVPLLFLDAWSTAHLNALSSWLPFYLTASILNISNATDGESRFIDTYSIGLEQTIAKHFTAKFDFGKTYYAGAQTNVASLGLSISFNLNDFKNAREAFKKWGKPQTSKNLKTAPAPSQKP